MGKDDESIFRLAVYLVTEMLKVEIPPERVALYSNLQVASRRSSCQEDPVASDGEVCVDAQAACDFSIPRMTLGEISLALGDVVVHAPLSRTLANERHIDPISMSSGQANAIAFGVLKASDAKSFVEGLANEHPARGRPSGRAVGDQEERRPPLSGKS